MFQLQLDPSSQIQICHENRSHSIATSRRPQEDGDTRGHIRSADERSSWILKYIS